LKSFIGGAQQRVSQNEGLQRSRKGLEQDSKLGKKKGFARVLIRKDRCAKSFKERKGKERGTRRGRR